MSAVAEHVETQQRGAPDLAGHDLSGIHLSDGAISPVDLSILRLVAEGYQINTVAHRLNLSGRTVRRRTRALCDRFGARAPIQVAVWAVRCGLI